MTSRPTRQPSPPAGALDRKVAALLTSLKTPGRIQDFINSLRWNAKPAGTTARSVAEVLRHGEAHCVEAAFVAAYALWVAGEPPLVMDMGASPEDVDHVVAVFRHGRSWGAISKSNGPALRYRDPIYRSLRELSLSYFPEYVRHRRKTLRTYSVAVDLRRHDPALWVTRKGFCHEVIDALTAARHFPLLPAGGDRHLRPIDAIEARGHRLKEYP